MPNQKKKAELTEDQNALLRKRTELARVLERLRGAGLTQGFACELRKHVATLEREITELEERR